MKKGEDSDEDSDDDSDTDAEEEKETQDKEPERMNEEENEAPRKEKKVTGRKKQDAEEIDAEINDAETKKGSKKARTAKEVDSEEEDHDKEEEVSRTSKKKKSATKNGKETKKEVIDEDGVSDDGEKDGKSSSKKDGHQKNTKKDEKLPKKFKRGVFNPDIDIVETCEMLESDSQEIIDYGTVHANNKNLIRAVYTENHKLLKELLHKDLFLSNIFQRWGPETDFNALELAFKKNDKKAVKMIMNVIKRNSDTTTNKNKEQKLKLAQEPHVGLHEIDTGYVSRYTFGVRVRRVAPARGGREGNNAFIADMKQPREIDSSLDTIARVDFDPEMFEMIRVQCGDNTSLNLLNTAMLSGNIELAAHIITLAEKTGGYNVGFLHLEALTKKKVSELRENIKPASVTKKATGYDSITPLHCAAINPNTEIFEHLISINPQYACPDSKGRKPIHYAACCKTTGALEMLIASGVDINEPDGAKITPLMYASFNGRVENVKLLLDDPRIVVDVRQMDRTTAIHLAAMYGHAEVLKVYHEKGANIDINGRFRMTPLILAAAHGHFDCVETLLECGAKINSKDRMKRNALVMAIRNGNVKIASYLLRHGSDFNKPDSSDNYPIHYAAGYGFPECIDLLVKAKADVNAANSWNLTALAVAMLKNNFNCVKRLLEIPDIDVSCKDDQGRTLVNQTVIEVSRNNIEHLKYLVKEKVLI